MPTFQYNGVAVHYGDSGDGSPLLLLHSGGSSGAQWRKTSYLLSERRLLTPDFYGYGRTEVVANAGLLSKALDVVAHSYGGAGAVRIVLRNLAHIRSLVLIEPMLAMLLREAGEQKLFAEYETLAHGFLDRVSEGQETEAFRFFIDYRNGLGSWDDMPEKTKARFREQTDATYEAFQSNLANPTTLADIRSISLPVTVICGGKTTAPDRRVTELLRDTLPNVRYSVIPDAEHMSPLTHPADVAAIIKKHLAFLAAPKDA